MKRVIRSVKGTKDIYPETMKIRRWIIDAMKNSSEKFGYQEFDAPCLESVDLYAAKSGDELVKEQSFVFPDRGGDLIALRPELTPSLARMVAEKQGELVFPLRWWSFGPFWRYERPQKGRSREFNQWNIDLIGSSSVEGDAELVAVAADFLKSVGLSSDKVKIYVNNRRLLDASLLEIGITPEIRRSITRLIDRLDKLPPDLWDSQVIEAGVNSEQLSAIKSLLTDKNLWKKSQELTTFFDVVSWLGVADYVEFDPKVIRGLDYYTGTVFEGWDVDRKYRAIFGGGHYDNLVAAVGGDPIPGVGFAMGDVVIELILEEMNCIPKEVKVTSNILVTIFSEEYKESAFKISAELRNQGLHVLTYPSAEKLSKQLKFADRIGAKIAIIAGPDEIKESKITIKNLVDNSQLTVDQLYAGQEIRKLLD
jgi:histidyl-tRNA synthetase